MGRLRRIVVTGLIAAALAVAPAGGASAVDDTRVGPVDPRVYTTPGGFVARAQGACVGYLGEWEHACANGVDGCGVQVWGSYLLPSGSCGE